MLYLQISSAFNIKKKALHLRRAFRVPTKSIANPKGFYNPSRGIFIFEKNDIRVIGILKNVDGDILAVIAYSFHI